MCVRALQTCRWCHGRCSRPRGRGGRAGVCRRGLPPQRRRPPRRGSREPAGRGGRRACPEWERKISGKGLSERVVLVLGRSLWLVFSMEGSCTLIPVALADPLLAVLHEAGASVAEEQVGSRGRQWDPVMRVEEQEGLSSVEVCKCVSWVSKAALKKHPW